MINKFLKLNLFNAKSFIKKRCFSEIAPRKSYYDVLNVSPHSEQQEIKEAYLKLAKLYHPDFHPGDDEKHKIFLQINEAYSVLSKTRNKEEYDLESRLHTMEVQYTPPNPWSLNYPLAPSKESDASVKDAYKLHVNKMWSEQTLEWQHERQHYQASRGLSLAPYDSSYYVNFNYFNRFSGQEVTIISAKIYFIIGIVSMMICYYCIQESMYIKYVKTNPRILFDNMRTFIETQTKYDINNDIV